MATMDLSNLFTHNSVLSKTDKNILEIILFIYLYHELIQTMRPQNINMENTMISQYIIKNLVNDLLKSDDYSLEGLAFYSGYPEEVVYDVAAGINLNPTLAFATKIIELHVLARRTYYESAIKNIIEKFQNDLT